MKPPKRNGRSKMQQPFVIYFNITWHPLEERTLVKHVYENGSWKESIYYPSKDFVRVKNTSGNLTINIFT